MLGLRALKTGFLTVLVGLMGVGAAFGQVVIIEPPWIPPPPHPPHPRPMPRPRPFEHFLAVKSQSFAAEVVDGVAVVKVDQTFHNSYPHQIEGTYMFPLVQDASVSGFSMFVDGREVKGEVLDRDDARRIYQDIVSKMRDPALLEYVGSRLYKARIFPIPPNGDVRVKLQYTQTLDIDAGLASLVLPLKADARTPEPAKSTGVVVKIHSQPPIKSVFSPSHPVSVHRESDHEASVSYETSDTRSDEDFVVHYMLSNEDFGLAWLTYREGSENGYFMARIAPKTKIDSDKVLAKDIAFVFDTSGSMSGEKIKQARKALKFCLSHLNDDDRFNIVPFSHEARPFKEGLVAASSENVDEALRVVEKLEASGGTNINDALLEALKASPEDGGRPYMIAFMTDGQPTIGETEPKRILNHVKDANASLVRLFVFGVGDDVNTQLLDRLAEENHGTRQYVRPGEDLEIKVSNFYRKVADPVLSDLEIEWGRLTVRDVFPPRLPDLFSGGELVVVGRYEGSGSCAIELTGRRGETRERYVYERTAPERETKHDFLPRLWAIRKIGYLLDEIRLHGENEELKDEVVRLAKRFGIVTPYTAYLVTEDEKLARREGRIEGAHFIGGAQFGYQVPFGGSQASMDANQAAALQSFVDSSGTQVGTGVRARPARASGKGAVAASEDMRALRDISPGELAELIRTAKGETGDRRATVEHVGGDTYYFVEGRWVDGEYDGKAKTRKVELYSDAYFHLIAKHPEVGKVLALGERVVFRVDGLWYETRLAEADEGEKE
jgi:Ca-activated chloride channel family protein